MPDRTCDVNTDVIYHYMVQEQFLGVVYKENAGQPKGEFYNGGRGHHLPLGIVNERVFGSQGLNSV
jgi:hypothetical protein